GDGLVGERWAFIANNQKLTFAVVPEKASDRLFHFVKITQVGRRTNPPHSPSGTLRFSPRFPHLCVDRSRNHKDAGSLIPVVFSKKVIPGNHCVAAGCDPFRKARVTKQPDGVINIKDSLAASEEFQRLPFG